MLAANRQDGMARAGGYSPVIPSKEFLDLIATVPFAPDDAGYAHAH